MISYDQSCDLCNEFFEDGEKENRCIARFRDAFILFSALGCFREGYSVYAFLQHHRSFASKEVAQLEEIERELDLIRVKIQQAYSSRVIFAEHGLGLSDNGASCCDHAHIYIIPVNDPKQVFMRFYNHRSDCQLMNKIADLTQYKDKPYIYLSCIPG